MRSSLLHQPVRCVLLCFFLIPGICAAGQTGFITAGKLRVHYKQQGAGKPIVFLHAGFQDMGMWDKQVLYFQQHHTVIAIDLPGHGATTGADTALLIQDVLRICLDSLHIQKASFVGLSLGAACATDFALAYPQRVDRLVLTSSGLSGWPAVLQLDSLSRRCFEQQDKAMQSANKDSIAACFSSTWCSGLFRKADAVNADARDYIYRTTLRSLQQHNSNSDWPRFATPGAALRMKSLSVPLLIIDGDKDIPFIITEADWIYHTVKDAELVTFNGVAHMLNLEIPDEFNRTVGRFLDQSGYTWQDALQAHLQLIQSGTLEQTGYEVYEIAGTWAAAGFIEQANHLLSSFWSYKTTDPNDFRNINNGFRVLWALSGKQPNHIPFALRDVKDIVQDNWDDQFYPDRWAGDFVSKLAHKPWTELSGPELTAKAIILSYNADTPTHRSSGVMRELAIGAYTKILNGQANNQRNGESAVQGAIVTAGAGKDEQAKAFMLYWGNEDGHYPHTFRPEALMKDTATARLLLSGLLAPVWGISKASCEAELQRVESILDKRIKSGPSLVYEQLSLKELLQRISGEAIKSRDIDYGDPVLRAKWLGYAPATAAQIHNAEKRLGVKLPEEYQSFLLLTNGFRSPGLVEPNFLPVQDIGWLRDMDAELVNLFGKPMDEKDSAHAAAFRRSLLIGGYHEEQQALLIPPGGSDKDWQCWYFSTSLPGDMPYPSLRYYLEHILQEQEDWRKQDNNTAGNQ